jgi:Protein of unknown function (DUF2845)
MQKLFYLINAAILLLGQNMLWAQVESFYCPTGQYVNKSMSEAQVAAACGEPVKKELLDEPAMKQEKVEELIYTLPTEYVNEFNRILDPARSGGHLTVVFTIMDGKVSSIEVDDKEFTSTTICGKRKVTDVRTVGKAKISIGDTRRKVFTRCDKPSFVNEATRSVPLGDGNVPVSIWTYDFGPYRAKVYMRFIDEELDSVVER